MTTDYDIKRGHAKNYELRTVMKECFGELEERDDMLWAKYGAIKSVGARSDGKKVLTIDMEMDREAPIDVAQETVSIWNEFLLKTTGFNSKERLKRLKQKAKKGTL